MKNIQAVKLAKKTMTIGLIGKFCLTAVAVPFLAAVAINTAHAVVEIEDMTYSIGLWGDLPYNDIQATIGVPNLIADMNAQKLAFTVHDGDLKAGNAIVGS